jgi:ankyrin repeat protein
LAELLIINGIDVNAKSDLGRTPLHEAAEIDSRDIVKLLISNGADVNAKTKDGWTPLHSAIYFSRWNKDVIELLLTNGADINAITTDGKTPLSLAKEKGLEQTVELLLNQGAGN